MFSETLLHRNLAAVISCASTAHTGGGALSSHDRSRNAVYVGLPDEQHSGSLSLHLMASSDSFVFAAPATQGGDAATAAVDPAVKAAVLRHMESLTVSSYFPLAGVLTSVAALKVSELARAAKSSSGATMAEAAPARSTSSGPSSSTSKSTSSSKQQQQRR